MKKIVTLIILLALSLSLFSCGDDEEEAELVGYYQMGLSYSIPIDFEARNLPYGDLTYTDGEDGYFFFNAFDSTALEEDMRLDPEITVREYTESYLVLIPYSDGDYEYDAQTDSTQFEYVYEYDDGVTPNEHYRFMILRGSVYLYQVTLSCLESDIEKYDATFDAIMKSIRAD